jgi:hypothetical protein
MSDEAYPFKRAIRLSTSTIVSLYQLVNQQSLRLTGVLETGHFAREPATQEEPPERPSTALGAAKNEQAMADFKTGEIEKAASAVAFSAIIMSCAAQAGITADKKTRAQTTSVIANTSCAFSAVLRFHMTPSQIEDHEFDLHALASSHCDSSHKICVW